MANNKGKDSTRDRVIKALDLKATGKGKKPFYKSVRFGYDSFEAIDSVLAVISKGSDGKVGFNDVFEKICTVYTNTVPEREEKLKDLDKKIAEKERQIAEKEKQLEKISKTISETQMIAYDVENINRNIKSLNKRIASVVGKEEETTSKE